MEKERCATARPVGQLRVTPPGHIYLPNLLHHEMGIKNHRRGSISYFISENCILLVRTGASLEEIVRGLHNLEAELRLRAFSPHEPQRESGNPHQDLEKVTTSQ